MSDLILKIQALTAGMQAFDEVKGHVDDLGNKAHVMGNKTSGAFGQASMAMSKIAGPAGIAAAAIGAVGAAFALTFASASEMADGLQKQSDVLSINTETLQQYNYVAKQSGTSQESITNGLSKLRENIVKASQGNKELSASFSKLDVSLTDNKGHLRDNTELTDEIFKKLADVKNSTQQSTIANDLFSKSYRDMLPILKNGSEGIDQLKSDAVNLGQVLSGDAVRALDSAGDSLDRLKTAFSVGSAEIVSSFAPSIESLATLFNEKLVPAMQYAGDAFGWMLKGKQNFEEQSKKDAALTKEYQDMIALQKEMEETIKTQEALKKSGGSLYSPQVLEDAMANLQTVKDTIKQMHQDELDFKNKDKKTDNKFNPNAGKADDKEAEKKAKEWETELNNRQKILENADKLEQASNDARLEAYKAFELAKINMMEDGVEKQKALLTQQLISERNAIISKAKANGQTEEEAWENNKDALLLINKKYNLSLQKIDQDAEKQKLRDQNKLADLLAKDAIDNEKDEWKKKKLQLALEKKQALADAKEKNQNLNDVNAYYTQKEINLYKSEAEFKKSNTKDVLSSQLNNTVEYLQTIAGKHREAMVLYQASAIAQTTIDTYKSAQSAYSAMSGIPYVGPALGAIAAAAAITAGLLNVAEISKQKFYNGGPISVGEMGPEMMASVPASSAIINHQRTMQYITNQNQQSKMIVNISSPDGAYRKRLEMDVRKGRLDKFGRLLTKRNA
jgi:hypothetical protein